MAEEIWETIIKAFGVLFAMILLVSLIPFVQGMANVVGLGAASVIGQDISALINLAESSPANISFNHSVRVDNTNTQYWMTGTGKNIIIKRVIVTPGGQKTDDLFAAGIIVDMVFDDCGPFSKLQIEKLSGKLYVRDITNPASPKVCFEG